MDKALTTLGNVIRSWMRWPAAFINHLSGGRIKPNHITLVSLLGHFGVVWALWQGRPILAALLLTFFGLMDTLDGALARLQKTTSLVGMYYDAVSDRIKEVILYIGIDVFLYRNILHGLDGASTWLITQSTFHNLEVSLWIVTAVCGFSLIISYAKAKGEMALSATGKYGPQQLNKIFADGIARYEVRMAIIVLGLLTGRLYLALHVLLVLLLITTAQRISRIAKALKNV